ncbi:deoxyribose-phosphate aldolase [Oceanispirochaeta sp.]|jgi:deoxyribose-phosphate aldolase|uniref:deoxyribose-phosphate aldolase n=1 Tax=Oceanispirochaeta sp. TaxID=2035350 RepID=UPI0026050308|nr:deoxyribose-phosphate aldolase [Oceanispirochaeta sp.]MDA3957520.1 deoxyribose-phosphate aldolase [Oceanispirochaeta sp.]
MKKKLSKYIDHTILKAAATPDVVIRICEEAVQYDFASVCVNACYTSLVAEHLKGSTVAPCVVVGFPLGASPSSVKAAECAQAVRDGALEVDMVLHIGQMKAGNLDYVRSDIKGVVDASGKALVKVILENCYLSQEEIRKACLLCEEAGADFVKTSTGFGTAGATVEDVALMKKTVPSLQVKAAGGIRDRVTALAMIEAGADRLGASAGIAIVQGDADAGNSTGY